MRRHHLFPAYLALAAVCFFWGTTYLAIRMALENFPPALLVGSRYAVSGLILVAAALWRRPVLPSRRDLLWASGLGIVILGGGNFCVTYAVLWIPSGLAALLVSTSPFWMVAIEAAVPGGERLRVPTLLGMLVGLVGAAVLIGPGALEQGFGGGVVRGFLVVQLGCFAWSLGSILQRRRISHMSAVLNGGLQQLAVGVVFLGGAVLSGQRPAAWTPRGVGAIVYLVIFGSIVGYTSYIYALKKLPVALVSTHNYVNPLVATVFGWLVYSEPFGRREILGMLVILGGVAAVKNLGGRGQTAGVPGLVPGRKPAA